MHAAYKSSEDLAGLAVTSFPLSACSTGPSWTGSHYLSTLHVQLALPGLGVAFPLHVELALPGPVSLTLWGSMYSFLFLFSVCCK